MPVIFRWNAYKFFFFSNEGEPLEPVHIHVRKDTSIAKFWVSPEVILANSYGFSAVELNHLRKLVKKNKDLILRSWNEYFRL